MGDFGPSLSSELDGLPDERVIPEPTTEDINILITGFGPFKTNLLNPSFLISSALPKTLSQPTPTNSPRQINLHTHPNPIRVSYSAVRTSVPAVTDAFKQANNGREPDITIHIGMASTRSYYSVETQAHRDGYRITDVDGEIGYEYGELRWRREGMPSVLRPGLNTETTTLATTLTPTPTPTSTTVMPPPTESKPVVPVSPSPPDATLLKVWRAFLPDTIDVRLSDDAGRYLCEFITYTSLARALREGHKGAVVFLHVPGWTDEDSVETGRDVAVALVRALVACWVDGVQGEEW
ncbi:hypothetical protein AJ80_04098 [Polytolypa hystricis UAMH7299]|uniref:Pyroglutamyl-peptidase I n=1 Tax=Polytolypa hystricis (strain UAMH7299) TaxID=1447883 RepID=A0A2B7YDW8_POLH7|nr:hypothetical protein AJ80_04098 [Polytolypa hystricis UAMH7299]